MKLLRRPSSSLFRMGAITYAALLAPLPIHAENVAEKHANLVPLQPSTDANYWCTWYAQNYWIQRGGEITNFAAINNSNARESLNDHNLFNKKDGWATTYLSRGRQDLTFLIDHGWQDKNKKNLLPGAQSFFSLQLWNQTENLPRA